MTTKTIKFELTLEGHGVVQTGGNEKGLTYAREDVDLQKYDNVIYAKGNFEPVRNADGEIEYITSKDGNKTAKLRKILKISGDGLRHSIHRNAMAASTPSILLSPESRIFATASLDSILRGWLSTSTEERKRSAYTITAAEDKEARLAIETFANSGPKTKRPDASEEASDTSLFARETTGDTKYTATGFIDIEELRFISVSDIYGRRAISNDLAELFRQQLSENIGSTVDVPRFWQRKLSASNIPEFGILLNDEQVHKLVTYLLKQIANIHIVKSASGFAQATKLDISALVESETAAIAETATVFSEGVFHPEVIPTQYAVAWTEVTEAEGKARVDALEAAIAADKKVREKNARDKKEREQKRKKNSTGAPASAIADEE